MKKGGIMKGRHEGLTKKEIDPVVDDRIERAIEQLQEHVPPTLTHYENFLNDELAWISTEKSKREILAIPLP